MTADPLLDWMKKKNIPLTRENYILLNWGGEKNPDEPLDPESEAELPEEFQRWEDE
jgi:hypothetical protein